MSSHIVKTSKTIRAPVSSVLAILHDPVRLTRLNPLVTDIIQSPTDPNSYTIREKIAVLGFIPLTTEASAKYTATDDGVNVEAQASSGGSTVRVTTQWKVKAQEDESCEVSETVLTLEASAWTKHFVIFMLRKSHKRLLEDMRVQLEGHKDTSSGTTTVKRWRIAALTVTLVVLALCLFLFNVNIPMGQACIAITLSLLLIILASRKMVISDPYGTFHVAFNIPPGEDPNMRPETEWLNMGYWKKTQVFPQACEALALRLIESANLIPGGHVLDVGHACGDSLLLQLRTDVPLPATLTGITSIPSHHARSLERVTKQCTMNPQACKVTLLCGDAIFRSENTEHPLNPSASTPPFSSILALDCAYHFVSREVFLRQSFVRLAPGGSIALADLAVSRRLAFGAQSALSKLLSVHPENMITPQLYEAQLKTIGYENIHIVDISDDVFPGFRIFLKSRGGLWGIFELVISWWVKAGGRFLIVSASKPETVSGSEIRSY